MRPDDLEIPQSLRRARCKRLNVAAVLRLLIDGLTVDQVAETLRCYPNAVRSKLMAAGLVPHAEVPLHGHRPDITVEIVRAYRAQGRHRATPRMHTPAHPQTPQQFTDLPSRART